LPRDHLSIMKKHLAFPLIFLLLATVLSGCIWYGPGGYRHDGYGGGYDHPHEGDGGGFHHGY
jgi:hypothetical protein